MVTPDEASQGIMRPKYEIVTVPASEALASGDLTMERLLAGTLPITVATAMQLGLIDEARMMAMPVQIRRERKPRSLARVPKLDLTMTPEVERARAWLDAKVAEAMAAEALEDEDEESNTST